MDEAAERSHRERLLTFVVIDYITGILAAWINCELSSHVGFNGIIKKICIFSAVAVAECITHVTGVPLPEKLIDTNFILKT